MGQLEILGDMKVLAATNCFQNQRNEWCILIWVDRNGEAHNQRQCEEFTGYVAQHIPVKGSLL